MDYINTALSAFFSVWFLSAVSDFIIIINLIKIQIRRKFDPKPYQKAYEFIPTGICINSHFKTKLYV